MITNKPNEKYITNYDVRQRLGNKTLFTNLVPNQNNINVRYFSSIDAEIYFEDVYIDECAQINFAVQQQALPIYGYNSYLYDDIALGSRIINGQFSINFTKSAYMYEVLDTLSAIKNNNKGSFTKSIDEHGPLWNKTFDIYMSYGDARQSDRPEGSTILVLKQVSLVSCSQDLNYTGKPIYETYQFIARDIDFINEGEYTARTTPNDGEKESSEEVLPIKYVTCILATDQSTLNMNFLFNPGFLIKSILYRIGESSPYTEAIELQNINTTEKDNYIVVDTTTPLRDFIKLSNEADRNKKDGKSQKNYYLYAMIEYEDYNGNTDKTTQKLIVI